MHGSQEHGSRSSLRPSSSSSNTARSTATPRLTVPVSPKLTSESRTRKRLVQGESSVASDADRSLSSSQLRRLSTSSAQSSQRSVAGDTLAASSQPSACACKHCRCGGGICDSHSALIALGSLQDRQGSSRFLNHRICAPCLGQDSRRRCGARRKRRCCRRSRL
jgi:hypothetical protein